MHDLGVRIVSTLLLSGALVSLRAAQATFCDLIDMHADADPSSGICRQENYRGLPTRVKPHLKSSLARTPTASIHCFVLSKKAFSSVNRGTARAEGRPKSGFFWASWPSRAK